MNSRPEDPVVNRRPEGRARRASPELVAVIALGVTILLTVLGQAAWLDGKIERVDTKLTAQIENLQMGQAAIRERLAALEAHSASANNPIRAQGEQPHPAS